MNNKDSQLNFTGCKLAYILNDQLLVYNRDDFPEIPFPGFLDFPGGGREGQESPEECVLRKLDEEFSIIFPASRLIYKRAFTNHTNNGNSFFFVAQGKLAEIEAISFSDEGQYWQLMSITEYLSHPEAVPNLVNRLKSYLNHAATLNA